MSAEITDYRHESPYLTRSDIFGKYLGLRKLNVSLRLILAMPIILNYTGHLLFFLLELFDLKLSIFGLII